MLTKSLLLGSLFLGQAAGGDIDGILGSVLGIIAKVSYIIAFCMFIYGCVRARSDLGEAVTPIGISVLIAIGAIILDTLFTAGGLPTIAIGQ
jgi:hypothetical protein